MAEHTEYNNKTNITQPQSQYNNQQGFALLNVLLAIVIGMFIMTTIYLMLSKVLTEDLQQSRYNNFLTDKDSFYLDFTETVSKADSITIKNDGIEKTAYGEYESSKLITTLTATHVYNNGLQKFQDIYEVTDEGDNIRASTNTFLITEDGKLEVVDTKQQSYHSLSDLYVEELNEVCYENKSGATECQSISNLLDIIVYSSGIAGKSQEFKSRRLVYYD